MSKSESAAVLEWLAKSGYPLEVSVGRTCRAQGWHVFHAFPYTDPTEAKLRECDVHASRFVRLEHGLTLSIELAIECKRSNSKPWVVFGEPVRFYDWLVPSMLAPGIIANTMLSLLPNEPLDPLAFLRPQKWVGYSVVKAHTSAKDEDPSASYSALRATVAAAEAFALRCEQELDAHRDWPPHFAVVLPALVVGAPLYLYTLDDNNEECVTPVEAVKVTAPQRRFEERCLISVIAEKSFAAWLAEVTLWADEALKTLSPRAAAIPKLVADARRVAELMR